MKGVKLKPLLVFENQILITPPDGSRELDNSNWKNCTFSTVEQLKDLLKHKRFNRQSILPNKEEEREQVEKLNHWRNSSAGGSTRVQSKKYTFRRKLSVSNDPFTIISIAASEYLKETGSFTDKTAYSIISEERNKSKLLKSAKNRITERNKNSIENTSKDLAFLSEEVKKISKNIKELKNEIDIIQQECTLTETRHESALKIIQHQENSLLLITRNMHMTKLFKLGEANEHYLFREKLRQEKQALHNEYTETKERQNSLLSEKQKDKENLVISKREVKREFENTKSILVAGYIKILRQGMDIREEGLRWVIKCLWGLEEPIPLSSFPKFLDEESSQFLLSMAKYELELAEYQARLKEIRIKIKQERSLSLVPKDANALFLNVKDRLRKISCSVKAQSLKKNDEASVEMQTNAFENTSCVNELTWIQENIDRLGLVMTTMSEKEVHRVTDIYKKAPSEIGLAHIFKVLLGNKARLYLKLAEI